MEKIKFGNTLVSSRADETLTYTRYVKDEATGKSMEELVSDKLGKTDKITPSQIPEGAITTDKIADGDVTEDKLHPDIKGILDKATTEATNQAARAEEIASHPNIIKDGYWWTWNLTTHQYVKTDQTSVGTFDFPTFFIDEEEKTLKANITKGTDAGRFSLDEDGSLRIKMNYR